MAYKTLQNPGLYGMGNDYEQDKTYVVEFVDKDGKAVAPGTEGAKSTWRDGIYTKLATDIKDPEGYNKRTVNVPQSAWGEAPSGLSGETDGSALFTSGYATAESFGYPFGTTPETYYTDKVDDGLPTGIDVASFRQVVPSADEIDTRK
jgi:hypothetical protein